MVVAAAGRRQVRRRGGGGVSRGAAAAARARVRRRCSSRRMCAWAAPASCCAFAAGWMRRGACSAARAAARWTQLAPAGWLLALGVLVVVVALVAVGLGHVAVALNEGAEHGALAPVLWCRPSWGAHQIAACSCSLRHCTMLLMVHCLLFSRSGMWLRRTCSRASAASEAGCIVLLTSYHGGRLRRSATSPFTIKRLFLFMMLRA